MSDNGEFNEVLSVPMPDGVDRVETGPIKFGDDWAGYFIRGDNAFAASMALTAAAKALTEKGDPTNAAIVSGLASDFQSCIHK